MLFFQSYRPPFAVLPYNEFQEYGSEWHVSIMILILPPPPQPNS